MGKCPFTHCKEGISVSTGHLSCMQSVLSHKQDRRTKRARTCSRVMSSMQNQSQLERVNELRRQLMVTQTMPKAVSMRGAKNEKQCCSPRQAAREARLSIASAEAEEKSDSEVEIMEDVTLGMGEAFAFKFFLDAKDDREWLVQLKLWDFAISLPWEE